ncbi:MAG: thioredoxin family protein [Candidatus Marinimicrobia bacterium]|nr:thioredoxin family protein [Candidatus Neomarinimicrobiota bacterium]MBL7010608.1 thioredoxin family protein [Candidatus Neomarinimicrobiota bacterium]MBL7030093.1 thioredoxin family protein [Candidatus Neomarinimicrobiota bacterium]
MQNKTFLIIGLTLSVLLGGDKSVFSDLTVQEAMVSGKPVMIKFHADWCHFCKRMDRETFTDKTVKKELEHFISLKIDIDTDKGLSLAHKYKVVSLPTIIILDSNGKTVYHQPGFHSWEQMKKVLTKFNDTK